MFLTGKTGSFKTSIAQVLFVQVEREEHRRHLRRLDSDTDVSMERGLILNGRDNVTVFDDFSPAQNNYKKNKLERSLEMLVRMVGDGSTRSRSNVKLEDQRGNGIKGTVVLTGGIKGARLIVKFALPIC